MEVTLYLVRHGQTDWNHGFIYQGRTDTPLSEVGRSQSRALSLRLSGLFFDLFYSSPLRRALETAEILASSLRSGEPLRSDERLCELNFGRWEGLSVSQVEELFGEDRRRWFNNPFAWSPTGGEGFSSLMSRVSGFLSEEVMGRLSPLGGARKVLVVSHGVVIRAFACVLLGIGASALWSLRLDNASLSVFQVGSWGASLLLWNDVSHLGDPLVRGDLGLPSGV